LEKFINIRKPTGKPKEIVHEIFLMLLHPKALNICNGRSSDFPDL